MDWAYIENISEYKDKTVELKGWLYNKRSSGGIKFLLIRDGTGIIQCVATEDDTESESFSLIDDINQESSILIRGKVREDKRAPSGYELIINSLEVVQNEPDYPITPKSHGVDFLLKNRHLWIRSKKQWAILRIRAETIRALEDFLWENGFLKIDAPIFTPSACEGTTTLFEVDYFGDSAYLSQSGQLYNEANCMSFGKVYCFGPSFRAEKSKTRRHLTEFWQIEPEMSYSHLEDAMEISEKMIEFSIKRILKNRKIELNYLKRDTKILKSITTPFPRIKYGEAVKLINKLGESVEFGEDFGAPQESILSENFDSPFMVTHFPEGIKAFYMRKDTKNPGLTLSFDVLAPEGYGEIVGGGEREYDLKTLRNEIKKRNLPEEAFKWYLDLREFGSVPHAGFGLGIERMVGWICGTKHIRETIPFPRMLDRVYP